MNLSDPTPTRPIRIAVADDHVMFASALAHLLNDEEGLEVVCVESEGGKILDAVRHKQPDVLLLDVRMPGNENLRVARVIAEEALPVRVVLVTGDVTDRDVIAAMEIGVRGIILKAMAPQHLVNCIRKVAAGGEWIEHGSAGSAMRGMMARDVRERALATRLTAREVQVFRVAVTGADNAAIANRLSISHGTVKMHLHSIYEKFAVAGRVELMAYAREHSLLE
jgi:DNA-binding NarL/FixJ family response regulator